MTRSRMVVGVISALLAGSALAQAVPAAKKPTTSDQPIEISSDKLDVVQAEHKAIFTGNVIAVQGDKQLRSAEMIVHYTNDDSAKPAGEGDGGAQGISRIDANGSVVFTTPTEVATGDVGIYDVKADTIDLLGRNVTLTKDKNVLRGNKLNYNITTGRSILTAGAASRDVSGKSTGGRVHGLFVPKSKNEKPTTPAKAGSK